MREANTAIQQRGSHKKLPPTQLTPMETQLVTTVSTYPQAPARDTTAGLPNSSTHELLTAGGSNLPTSSLPTCPGGCYLHGLRTP